jgi:hypothetical protein
MSNACGKADTVLSQSPHTVLPTAAGQGSLLAVAVTLLVSFIIAGSMMVGLNQMNAKRVVVTEQTLQTYYVAQAGIQEALATRMVPRSNYLNFLPTKPTGVTPYINASGMVYQDPRTQQNLVGVYQYLIVGGDPSRKPDSSYYNIPTGPPFTMGGDTTQNAVNPVPRLVTFQSSPPDSPFYTMSQGFVCKSPGGAVGINQFVGSPTTNPAQIGLTPQCKAPFVLDALTLVSQVAVESENPSAADRLSQLWQFKNPTNINLNGPAFIPGQGWIQNGVNFTTAWQYNANNAGFSPARLTRIVFFNFGPNKIYQSVDLTANATRTTVGNAIPINASMMLYFNGPIDYRSLSANLTGNRADLMYERNLAGCKLGDQNGAALPNPVNDTNNCAIQLYANPVSAGTGGTQYPGMIVVPILPYLTKVLLLAPIGNNVGGNTNYEIRVRNDITKSASLAPGPVNQYTIAFRTCPVSGGPAYCAQ